MSKQSRFVLKAITKHSGTIAGPYDYSLVNYVNSKTPIIIICEKHGRFTQTPSNHLRSSGCLQCGESINIRRNANNFLRRAIDLHNNRYEYQLQTFKNTTTKMVIICKKHGKFAQTPQFHLAKHGCPKCGLEATRTHCESIKTKNSTQFERKARKIHGSKYQYLTQYISAHRKMRIVCKKHGMFEQTPASHLKGHGCRRCADESKKLNNKEFLEKAKGVHNDLYDYSKVDYVNANSRVIIICDKHKEFKQRASTHLAGHGCPQCAIEVSKLNTLEFISNAKNIHGNKFQYGQTVYTHSANKVKIKCPKHGAFEQIANNHTNGNGCPKCGIVTSRPQKEMLKFVSHHFNGEIISNDRQLLSPQEIDILIPGVVGIEYHGIFHHSSNDTKRDKFLKYRMQQKARAAFVIGINLLQFYSYEWENRLDICKSMILDKLRLSQKEYARNLEIMTMSTQEERIFFDDNHMQGYKPSTINFCLRSGSKIFIAMSFVKHKTHWEIQRFAAAQKHTIIGGKHRLFKKFLQTFNPQRIVTFADLRYSGLKCYENLGFRQTAITEPNYKYVKNSAILSRWRCQKHKLPKLLDSFDPTLSEPQNMFNNGYRRLWDAGSSKFEFFPKR